MHGRIEGFDLFQERRHQLPPCGGWCARYVVNGFVGVQLNALAARVGQGITIWALMPIKPNSNAANKPAGPAPIIRAWVSMGCFILGVMFAD